MGEENDYEKIRKKRRELAEAENLLENGKSLPVVETLERKNAAVKRRKKHR